MNIRVTFNATDALRGLERLAAGLPKAQIRAVNRAADSARTQLVRDVATNMKLKQADVRSRTAVVGATNTPTAKVTANTKQIPAIDFGAKQIGGGGRRRRSGGVSARLPGFPLHNAFIRQTRRGRLGVFQRQGRARLPIAELHGPSVWYVASKNTAGAVARALEQMRTRLAHEISQLLR